jgi:hypothetical protein
MTRTTRMTMARTTRTTRMTRMSSEAALLCGPLHSLLETFPRARERTSGHGGDMGRT